MTPTAFRVAPRFAVLAAVLATSCTAAGPRLYKVTGRVTFKGQPVQNGRVMFDPDPSKGNDGPQGFAPIEDGAFDTSKNGRGTVGGPVRVRIEGRGEKTADYPAGVPLCVQTVSLDLPRADAEHDFDVPASAFVKPPPPGVPPP